MTRINQKGPKNRETKRRTSQSFSKTSRPKTDSTPNKKSFLSKIKQSPSALLNYRPSKGAYLLLLAIGLVLLASYKKEWFIAATVNNTPVSNLELQQRLNKQYREQVLTQMINEKILLNEAGKKGVTISNKELDNKVAEVETKVGGSKMLDSLLSSQGQNRDSFRQQLKFQLIIEKIYDGEATVSAQEVEKFITENKDRLQATDSAGQQKEAQDLLKQEKLSQIFAEKFQQLKQQAKIRIF
ncbi:MAG: Foldase protein PrsA [Candidatus Daviesbacteria bacterium GW2011_GWA1_41_61]|uniref:Foldase protein PrsA n=1 Tax=Candidatus Daviesbacteria bacterium GW2011_GWA2_40_9 TaxID=1618424 RepID=A0A0G0X721_9BACT|nr:MAG: Foldase protein PrsA [Candidatus Daviesbacteria bacterium GW2011_GWC1_40_9]KKR83437.1 MAG: Foldase protein PrsA [Candidatus Daviesbacteria bacterium GW2011_GWA2_40_9]KKR93819.1 MAG: Foldase protein PrsA [Candidatus Daviesbacteria bacterium GW2011_GWB1_41_15]KKS15285.1 MAG: Foldase protein PrsA [Candidatus Daviesbacteria bacterium GW2011_GWA1_41_61]